MTNTSYKIIKDSIQSEQELIFTINVPPYAIILPLLTVRMTESRLTIFRKMTGLDRTESLTESQTVFCPLSIFGPKYDDPRITEEYNPVIEQTEYYLCSWSATCKMFKASVIFSDQVETEKYSLVVNLIIEDQTSNASKSNTTEVFK